METKSQEKNSVFKKHKYKIFGGIVVVFVLVIIFVVLPSLKKTNTPPPVSSSTTPPCKKREGELYCGCGYCYASRTEFTNQCAGGNTNIAPTIQKFIGDGLPNQNPCTDLKRVDPLYCGCGYCYATRKDHLEQCAGGNTNITPTIQKWIGDGVV